jgi:hypothetical protein
MLQVFYLDVAYVCNRFQVLSGVFQVFQTHILSVSFISFCMLQVLHLDVLKVDRMLYMGCLWEAGEGASDPCTSGHPSGAGPAWARETQAWADDVRAAWALRGRVNGARKQTAAAGVCPYVRALAMSYYEVTLFFLSH